MSKKILWLVIIILMVSSLVMSACGPSATTITSPIPATVPAQDTPTKQVAPAAVTAPAALSEEKTQKEAVSPGTPKYGGVLLTVTTADPNGFDPGLRSSLLTQTIYWTHDKLLQANWAKGPAGTHDTDWQNYLGVDFGLLTGSIAESYELPDSETIIFHIRQGVHFWNKAPANGREVIADDVVYSLKREWDAPLSFNRATWTPETVPTSIKALDKYTVELKIPAAVQGLHIMATGSLVYILPQELIKQYSNMDNWRNVVGTGPFMMADYVPGSSMTFVKNNNYFMVDPMHKENQIPYIDGFKRLIIPDASTRQAAFRTGKIDYIQGLVLEDFKQQIKQNHKIEYAKRLGAMVSLIGRMDKIELPFKDIRVRRAMNLAVDQKAILDTLYQGDGLLLGWPWYPIKEHEKAYIPLEKLPADVQELLTYNPDKAKQLLKEAGYPNGFKTEVLATSSQVDNLSILKDYLAKVNIDLSIKIVDSGTYSNMHRLRTFPEMIYRGAKMYFLPWMMHEVRQESFDDVAFFESPETRAAYNELQLNLGKDDAKSWQILKDITPFMLQNIPVGVMMPVPYSYSVWWPWLQNWFNATSLGYWEPDTNYKYAWIDQAMKKGMGY